MTRRWTARRVGTFVVAIVGMVACVALLSTRVDLDAIGRTLAGASPLPLLAGAGTMLVVIALAATKVQAVCRAGGLDVPWGRALRAVLTAATLNPLVPGRGGELVKAIVLAPAPDRRVDAVALVVAERMLDVAIVSLAAVGAGALAREWRAVAAGGVMLSLVVAAVVAGAMMRSSGGRLARATDALARMTGDPAATARAIGWTAATWSGNVVILASTFRAAGAEASALEIAFAAPVSMIAGMLPITIAGLGTREAALVLLLGARIDEAALVAGGLLYTVCTMGVAWGAGAVALAVGVVTAPVREPEVERPEGEA